MTYPDFGTSFSYKGGYKYQLQRGYNQSLIAVPDAAISDFISLNSGQLSIAKGYAWDGPSGPTIDTKNFMRGSLVHDALYQLMRESELSVEYRQRADELLYDICRQDGMSWVRAKWVYYAVRAFGGKHVEK
jgi:Protein of unknown function (DUF1353)